MGSYLITGVSKLKGRLSVFQEVATDATWWIAREKGFKEPTIRPNQYAIQIHRDSINAVMATLKRNQLEEYVMPGSDSKHSQMFFAHLTRQEVGLLADTHGSAPYFAILPVTWYQGDGIKSMHRVFEAFAKKSPKGGMGAFHDFHPSCHALVLGRRVQGDSSPNCWAIKNARGAF